MNALPTQVTVSIAVSSRFPVEALDELYTGVHKACAVYGWTSLAATPHLLRPV